MQRSGDVLQHGLLFEAKRGGTGGLFGIEGTAVLTGPAKAPAVTRLVDFGIFGAGERHLIRGCQ